MKAADFLQDLHDHASSAPWITDLPENQGPDGHWGVWHLDSGGPICFVGDPYPRGANYPTQNMELIATVRNALPELVDLIRAAEGARHHGWNTDAGAGRHYIVAIDAALDALAVRFK